MKYIPKVFTVIVTYNAAKYISDCIDTLLSSTIETRIIIIDNLSTDDTISIIKKNYQNIDIIESERNLGFGAGNNKGLRIALDNKAEYIFLLNQDAWIQPDTISKLIEKSKKYPEFGLLSPIHLNGSGRELEKGFAAYISPPIIYEYLNDLYFNNIQAIYEVPFINAACWLLPVSTIKRIGGFDPLFFHYGEDVDYCNRVNKKNLKTGFSPDIRVHHLRDYSYYSKDKLQKKINFSKEYAKILNYLKKELESNPKAYRKIIMAYLKKNIKNLFGLKTNGLSVDFKILKSLIRIKKDLINHIKNEKFDHPWYL